MSAKRYLVLAKAKVSGLAPTFSVLPADGVPLSHKEAQRLASNTLNDHLADQCFVVEVVAEVNPQ